MKTNDKRCRFESLPGRGCRSFRTRTPLPPSSVTHPGGAPLPSIVDAKGVADFSPGLSAQRDTLGRVCDDITDPNGVEETILFLDPVGVVICAVRNPRVSPRSSAQPWAKINDPLGVKHRNVRLNWSDGGRHLLSHLQERETIVVAVQPFKLSTCLLRNPG